MVELGRMGKTAVITGRDAAALDGMCTSTRALPDLVDAPTSAFAGATDSAP